MNNLLNEKTEIIIFGCGNTTREFLSDYGDRLNITAFWSNDIKEKEFSLGDGKKFEVVRPISNNMQNTGNRLITICSIAIGEISEQLMMLGYIPFKDFIDVNIARLILSKKSIALMFGACHLRAVKDALLTSKAFSEKYEAFFLPNYMWLSAYDSLRLGFLAENCDLFIYGISAEPFNYRKNKALLERIDKNACSIALPIICFGGYFPQIDRPYNRMNRYAVKCEGQDYTPFSYEDSYINKCIDDGDSVEEIIRKISNYEVYDIAYITQMLEYEWNRIGFQEMETEIKVLEYLRDNYQKRRLFRNEAHMETEVIYHYARQIVEYLEIQPDFNKRTETFFYCSQHPVYGCTVKALGLEWDVEEELLDLYTYEGWKKVTREEFINAYVESASKIKELKAKGLLPR